MATKLRVDFDALKKFNETLFRIIGGLFNIDGGVHEINPDELQPANRKKLFAFFSAQLKEAAEKHQQADFAIDTSEAAKRQKTWGENAAIARLEEYAAQGLEDSQENMEHIQRWVKDNLKGYWSAAAVDFAVQNLGPRGTNVLKWKAPDAPKPVVLPEASTPRTLPNGEPELPLDSGEATMRRASKAQLQDLSRRRGEGQNLRKRDGWTGASL